MPFRFLDLSPELRNTIYELVYPRTPDPVEMNLKEFHNHLPTPALALVCRQLHNESSGCYRDAVAAFWRTHVFRFKYESWTFPPVHSAKYVAALSRVLRVDDKLADAIADEGGTCNFGSRAFYEINFGRHGHSQLPLIAKLDEMLRMLASIETEADK